jgi:hypothetical protein
MHDCHAAGMNAFLKNLDITFRRDPTNYRPRINKHQSTKDREQKLAGTYYVRFCASPAEHSSVALISKFSPCLQTQLLLKSSVICPAVPGGLGAPGAAHTLPGCAPCPGTPAPPVA